MRLGFMIQYLEHTCLGETGVSRDTGSRGTVGGKIVNFNPIKNFFSMSFRYMPSNLA
jgi:hypothetical protein